MIREGLYKQYRDIAGFYGFDAKRLGDIVLAVIVSDCLGGSNRQGLDLERFLCADGSLSEFLGFGRGRFPCKPLPDVQILRILCDSLVVASEKEGCPVEGAHLTGEASVKACSAYGGNLKSRGYSDEAECYRVFDAFVESCGASGCDKEFQYISESFRRMHELDEKLGSRKAVFNKQDFSGVWLPEGYKSYGFNVSRGITPKLRACKGMEDFCERVELTFLREAADAFVKRFFPATEDKFRTSLVISTGKSMKSKCQSSLPIAVGVTVQGICGIKLPVYGSSVAYRYLGEILDAGHGISRDSLERIFEVVSAVCLKGR